MADDTAHQSEYQRTLSWGIVQQRKAMHDALTKHSKTCICRQLALFILEEAGWSLDAFLAYCRMVEDDEL